MAKRLSMRNLAGRAEMFDASRDVPETAFYADLTRVCRLAWMADATNDEREAVARFLRALPSRLRPDPHTEILVAELRTSVRAGDRRIAIPIDVLAEHPDARVQEAYKAHLDLCFGGDAGKVMKRVRELVQRWDAEDRAKAGGAK